MVQKASVETEASPFVIRARNAAAPLSVQKFLTFDGYWFHLLGYLGVRSPTVAPEPPGDSDRIA